MNDREQAELREKLREAVPPMREPDLDRDLWPEMLQRIQTPAVHVPWFDWALAAVAVLALFFLPELIPAIFYHL